jgi:anti-anti-sigma factor
MEAKVVESGPTARVTVRGDIDEAGAQLLKHHFTERHLGTKKEVVFDFQEVGYIGSAGLGKLLLFYKDLAVRDGRLKIENASSIICDLLRELKLDTLFHLT